MLPSVDDDFGHIRSMLLQSAGNDGGVDELRARADDSGDFHYK
jgi:hypothetical protein